MVKHSKRGLAIRRQDVERVLSLFRGSIPEDEFDAEDWDSLRVAVRLVYETEAVRVLLHGRRFADRDFAISYWIDSMESGIEFMSWTKALASIVQDVTYPKERYKGRIENLWVRHRGSAARLLSTRMSPGRRLSLLVELGGMELSLLGQLWWLEPPTERTMSGQQPKTGRSTRQNRVKGSLRRSGRSSKR